MQVQPPAAVVGGPGKGSGTPFAASLQVALLHVFHINITQR